MVIVTHNEALAARVPRVVKMRDGHVVSDETTVLATEPEVVANSSPLAGHEPGSGEPVPTAEPADGT
jgi:hypothetical protein